MSTSYGPQLPTEADVQTARGKAWDALAADFFGLAAIDAFDDYMATSEAKRAAARSAQAEPEAGG